MAQQGIKRGLAAILAADVVGYSRLMEFDEEGTHARLKGVLQNWVDPYITKHNGRIIKLTGDGVLAEFQSVVQAVQCAIALQRSSADWNAGVSDDQHILFRMGVNLGDIIIEKDDIYGGSVNVASRLEGLADPGGILISGTAYDQVEGKLDCGIESIGEREVKNIERPVRVYRLLLNQAPADQPRRQAEWSKLREPLPIVAMLVLIAICGTILWLSPWSRAPYTGGNKPANLPDKPSIAVLPFDNLSEETTKTFLADGITEDIITELSRNQELFVIARNSTFVYKDKAVDIREVGKALNVQYVLEGSLRNTGDQLNVTAQLIDATTNNHVWAERFDRELDQFFEIQSELVQTIVGTLVSHVRAEEAASAFKKPTEDLRAYDLVKQAIEYKATVVDEDLSPAIDRLEEAIRLDPNYAQAYVHLGWSYWMAARRTDREDAERERGIELIGKALKLEPKLAVAYQAMTDILGETPSRQADALEAAERAVELDPNDAKGWILLAAARIRTGAYDEAVPAAELALRLNPLAPVYYPYFLAEALYATNEFDAAVSVSGKCRLRYPEHKFCYRYLIASLVQLGEAEKAREFLTTLLEIQPDYSIEYIRARPYFAEMELNERFIDDLRRAGLQD